MTLSMCGATLSHRTAWRLACTWRTCTGRPFRERRPSCTCPRPGEGGFRVNMKEGLPEFAESVELGVVELDWGRSYPWIRATLPRKFITISEPHT